MKIPQILTLIQKYTFSLYSSFSTHLVRPIKAENPDNQVIIRVYSYPDPGSNRDGSESTGV